MHSAEELKQRIKEAFGDVPFPEHCGFQAAIAMDDWISDPLELQKITESRDIKGKWWEIPPEEMKYCSLASCYLDDKGTEFYLPAYMTAVVDDPCYPKYSCLLSWLSPRESVDDRALYEYFLTQFSKISGPKKAVCVEVLKYIRVHLDPKDHGSEKDIEELLSHDFWSAKC